MLWITVLGIFFQNYHFLYSFIYLFSKQRNMTCSLPQKGRQWLSQPLTFKSISFLDDETKPPPFDNLDSPARQGAVHSSQ